MKHRILTCKNHPNLRWSCKDIAWTEGRGYNGCRNIFFKGTPSGEGMYSDGSGLHCEFAKKCDCPAEDLILAPEDKLVGQASTVPAPAPASGTPIEEEVEGLVNDKIKRTEEFLRDARGQRQAKKGGKK